MLIQLSSSQKIVSKFKPKKFYEINPWFQSYKHVSPQYTPILVVCSQGDQIKRPKHQDHF